MTERKLLTDFTKEVKRVLDIFWYKIPDTYGGQEKPFDVFAAYEKRPICIEFKKKGKAVQDHQIESLTSGYNAGAICLIGEFCCLGERTTDRDIFFRTFPYGEKNFSLLYKVREQKEKYPDLEKFFKWVICL